ncbi:short chain dehydrogenase/reductase [Patellaria atrata CBS 101060]|uniref:Short chain dehydrogenase/reductase n=1 Tax=Patellaria atrata CBS 101060 TaxID=1346257 RepID=A0A9P4SEP0_9PEZI|nr:short chain dehydrogenase/reductase [Patellaria atrata CBS 101060]
MASTVVLITGANSGVGYATTAVLVEASSEFHVIMAGRSLDKLQTAMSEIQATGIKGSLSTLYMDITDDESIKQAADTVMKDRGRLDVLVNNAAIGFLHPDLRTRLRVSMETNVFGSAVVAEIFRPLLLKSSNPYSIYVSSGVGSLTGAATDPWSVPMEEGYRTSKAALNMLAVLEQKKYKSQGLKTFTMCPGLVVSNLRGTSDEARTLGGKAGDPRTSGETILSIIQGKRDAESGTLIHKDGVYPW